MAQAAREFQVFAKPIGPVCNLDCRYCYYLKTQRLYSKGSPFRMSDDLLEEYIVQHLQAAPKPLVAFSWHGGEPTLLGLDFFRRIVSLQRKHRHEGQRLINGIQTNGTLIDEEWCRFFAAEKFSVGLSLDGPQEFHDRYRTTKGNKPTYKRVVRAFKLLRRHAVPCDLLCVVHDQNVPHPTQVYRFFKELGADNIQFLPLVERMNDSPRGVSARSVPAEAFGFFLCAIFDEWMRQDVGKIIVQWFDESLRPFLGIEHALCILRERCGELPVVEHNGDFYSCDHFVDAQHRLGNIREISLAEMLESPVQRAFGDAKRDALPRYCWTCDVLAMCHGGCPKDRFLRTPDGEGGLNYLCAAFKRFFTHSRPYLKKLASLMLTGEPIGQVQLLRAAGASHLRTGRNDPCPCGSGRKYKKCCLKERPREGI